jgi:hypothetical protein
MEAMTEIVHEPSDQYRREFDLPHDRVAAATEQPANCSRLMVMVDDQIASRGVTEDAPTVLRLAHGVNLGGGESVLPHQPCAQILCPRSLGVRSAPLAKSLVPAPSVGDPVGAVPLASAGAALGPAAPPVGEVGIGKFAGADAAGEHDPIMPRGTDTQPDQPCHADVLLELANPRPLCPECQQGKERNCIGWTLDADDNEVPCEGATR